MKRFLKIGGITLSIIIGILIVVYFYIVNHAAGLIKAFVSTQSEGKMSIEMKRLEFKPFELRLFVEDPHFITNDSLHQPSTYDIRADRLILDLSALKPLLFEGKIQVDTLFCMRPAIVVNKWKDQEKEKFTLPEQMGKVYHSLDKIINKLSVKYFLVDSGYFSLVNKLHPEQQPVTITDYYLFIDNFKNKSPDQEDTRLLYSDRIKFYSSHQDIVFPDGNHGLRYRRLRINSLQQRIVIDSCYIYGKAKGTGFNEYGIYFDTLKLTHADFANLTKNYILKADSAMCINPEINFHAGLKEKTEQRNSRMKPISKDSVEHLVKKLFGNIDIKHVGVVNGSVNVQVKKNDKISPYSIRNANFSMENIRILDDPDVPLHLGGFNIQLKGYRNYSPDSLYAVQFESIEFRENRISLSEFSFVPTPENKNLLDRKEIRTKSLEIADISWIDLVTQMKFNAGNATLISPEINIISSGKKNADHKNSQPIHASFRRINQLIDLNTLKIRDAKLNFSAAGKINMKLEKVNMDIAIHDLLQTTNISDMTSAAEFVSFGSGVLFTPKVELALGKGDFNGKEKRLLLSGLNFKNKDGSAKVKLSNVRIEKIRTDSNFQFEAGFLGWDKAELYLNQSSKNKIQNSKNAEKGKNPQVKIEGLDLRNTTVKMKNTAFSTGTFIEKIQTGKIVWDGKNKPAILELMLEGKNMVFDKNKVHFSAQQFSIKDRSASSLNGIYFSSDGGKDSISVKIPRISFTPDISSILINQPAINEMVIYTPSIMINRNIDSNHNIPVPKKIAIPYLNISQITVVNPEINNLMAVVKKVKATEMKSSWMIKGIHSDKNTLTIDQFKTTISGISAETEKLAVSVPAKGKLTLNASAIRYVPATGNSQATWAATIDMLDAHDVQLTAKKHDSLVNRVNIETLALYNISLKNEEKITIDGVLKNNRNFKMVNTSFNLKNEKNQVEIVGLSYDQFSQQLSFDSMGYRPAMDKESFMKTKSWQTVYLQIKTGKTLFRDFNLEKLINDTVFYTRKIESEQPMLNIYKDKQLPFQAGIIKPLPVELIRNMNRKLRIDSIVLNNADIEYEELNDKTLKEGSVHLNKTNVLVTGIKNVDINPTDSFRLVVSSWLMDTAFLRLGFFESYQDSLHGFLIGVRLRPFPMTALNPFLEPIVSAKIKKGWLDTLRMNAIGRENVAHGKIKIYYRDLRVQYLNKGDNNVKTLKTRLINFAANDLILHKKHQKGINQVYAERVKDKGFINYWIKIVLSGVMSGTGVKSNKKLDKKYQKKIQKLKVPDIPDIVL